MRMWVRTAFILNIYMYMLYTNYCVPRTSVYTTYIVKNGKISSRGRSVGANSVAPVAVLVSLPSAVTWNSPPTPLHNNFAAVGPGGSLKRQLAPRLHDGVVVTLGPGFCAPDDTRGYCWRCCRHDRNFYSNVSFLHTLLRKYNNISIVVLLYYHIVM